MCEAPLHGLDGREYTVAMVVSIRNECFSLSLKAARRRVLFLFLLIHYTHMQLSSWNGVIKSNSQIFCCHGRVALSKAYNCYQPGVKLWIMSQASAHQIRGPTYRGTSPIRKRLPP